MLQLFTKKHRGLASRNSRGFTLIELLVVIAIIGILASIVLVSMGGARQSARNATRKADMRQIISAQEMFYNANDRFYTCSTTAGDCGGKLLNYPSSISTFMTGTPKDPGSNTYTGLDNTAGADNQKFCYYVALEETPAKFYTSSHGGNFTKAAAPTTLDGCATQD